MTKPTRRDFRTALTHFLREAEEEGKPLLDVSAGSLHKSVGGYPGTPPGSHRMPQCCGVMRGEMRPGDEVLQEPPSGQGASLTIRYQLPRP